MKTSQTISTELYAQHKADASEVATQKKRAAEARHIGSKLVGASRLHSAESKMNRTLRETRKTFKPGSDDNNSLHEEALVEWKSEQAKREQLRLKKEQERQQSERIVELFDKTFEANGESSKRKRYNTVAGHIGIPLPWQYEYPVIESKTEFTYQNGMRGTMSFYQDGYYPYKKGMPKEIFYNRDTKIELTDGDAQVSCRFDDQSNFTGSVTRGEHVTPLSFEEFNETYATPLLEQARLQHANQ